MIKLSAPFNPGDDYDDGPYTHAMVQSCNERPDGVVIIAYVYGVADGEDFVASRCPSKTLVLQGADAVAFQSTDTTEETTRRGSQLKACCGALARALGA